MFYVGQKVVCVDDELGRYLPAGYSLAAGATLHGLRSGRVYTIRDLVEIAGVKACRLQEILRPCDPILHGGLEATFAIERFRPIQERKTDIGFAHEILRKVTKKAPADQRKFETASAVGS